jgi:hypothetical protein
MAETKAPEQAPGVPTPEAQTVIPKVVPATETRRQFTWRDANNLEHKLEIRRPTSEEISASDFEYARVFNEAVMEGISPRSALVAALRERGIDFEAQGTEIDSMQEDLNRMIEDLETARDSIDKDKVPGLKDEIKYLRQRIVEKRSALTEFGRQSAEQMANDARDLFVLATVIEENGKPFLASPQTNLKLAMKERLRKISSSEYAGLRMIAGYEFMTFANGLKSDFVSQFPENLKESWDETPAKA